MPFWKGDGPGRPLEFGRAIGQLMRRLLEMPRSEALLALQDKYGLDAPAAKSLMRYLADQNKDNDAAPHYRCIVIDCFPDEIGDWRIVILSPFGSRVHAPWAMLISSRLRATASGEVDVNWTDDGIVFRIPDTCGLPALEEFFPDPDELESNLVTELSGTALFAAKFRENAVRSLLLPRRSPQKRSPLWLQRRRAARLLKVASRFPLFPVVMETYRECFRDVFDLPGLTEILRSLRSREIAVQYMRSDHPSSFSASVLFNYTGNYIYGGDAPLTERRAATLTLDHVQLKELLGTAEFRDLFDSDVIAELALELKRLNGFSLRDADDLHDLLIVLGPLSKEEIYACGGEDQPRVSEWLNALLQCRRIFPWAICGWTAGTDDLVLPPLKMPAG